MAENSNPTRTDVPKLLLIDPGVSSRVGLYRGVRVRDWKQMNEFKRSVENLDIDQHLKYFVALKK